MAQRSTPSAILGIDVGGTFTDAVLVEHGRVRTAKVLTRLHNQEESVLEAAAAVGASTLARFTHGTTIATNALLERKGATTAFVATEGFEHLLYLRRQTRAHLYRPEVQHPQPLVPLEACLPVRERMGPDGVIDNLDASSIPEIDAEAIAICLLFSFRNSTHERELATALRRKYPNKHVVASHEIAPEFREYERASTTVADAYLSPLLGRYLRSLALRCEATGLPRPLVMRSSGGVATLEEAASHAAICLVSGPAGGAVGAARVAELAGVDNAIAFDMGGTSTDVCPIVNGAVARAHAREVDGLPISLPMVDIHTVGAGGGSIVWRDAGGALHVGPHSAGADPGPACYGRGGKEPTVTDANLLLGRVPSTLAGRLELDRDAAERALNGIDPSAVIEIVNAQMLHALRVVSVERGLDPRKFALVAFGGAGPLHACALADELGCRSVLVPDAAGVLSAVGLAVSDERRDFVRSEVRLLDEVRNLPLSGEADLRYRGQSFELSVPLGGDVKARFHQAHADRYGYALADADIELVAIRTAEVHPGPELTLSPSQARAVVGETTLELPGATCFVPSGWTGKTHASGTWILERT